jgi:hypothetical protein
MKQYFNSALKYSTNIMGASIISLSALIGNAAATEPQKPTLESIAEKMPPIPHEKFGIGFGTSVFFYQGKAIWAYTFDTTGGYNPNFAAAYLECFEPVKPGNAASHGADSRKPETNPFAVYVKEPGAENGLTRLDLNRDGIPDVTFSSQFPEDIFFEKYAHELDCKNQTNGDT